jgi:hypothetical protein
MIHKLSAGAIVCALFAISMAAYAQGRPAGAGSQGGGGRPSMSQQQDRGATMRQDSERRRQQSEARRQAAEDKRLAVEADAAAKRAAGEAHNRSEEMRALHPPQATLPEEAGLQSGNDRNATDRGSHRNTTGVTQRDAQTRVQGDDDEPDDD